MIFSKEVMKKIFEESFNDEVVKISHIKSSIYFRGKRYRMEYNPLDGYITFAESNWNRIGTISLHNGSDTFFDIDPSTIFGYSVILFKFKLEKYIKLNQKKSRRKFISR